MTHLRQHLIGLLALTVALSGLLACNPYSRDDLVFALSLPPIEDVAITPPGVEVEDLEENDGEVNQSATSAALEIICADGDLRCTASSTASAFNRLTYGLLRIIDSIVNLPPTYRGTLGGNPRRVWGPTYLRGSDSTLRLEMVLNIEAGAFELCLAGAPGNLENGPSPDEMNCGSDPTDFGMVGLLEGGFIPGPIENGRARSGAGFLVLDGNALSQNNPRDALPGVYTIQYDNRSEVQQTAVRITDLPENVLAEAGYLYTRNKATGAGTFAFAVLQDFTPGVFGAGRALERLDVTAQWDETQAGRGDALVSGGDLNDFTYRATHCWGSDGTTTYYDDADESHETVGTVDQCRFQTPFVPAEPDE